MSKSRKGRRRQPRTSPSAAAPPPPEPIGFFRFSLRDLRRYLVTGMMVWVPLIVTLWISWWLISKVGFGIEGMIKHGVAGLNALGVRYPRLEFLTAIHYAPGLGFLLAIVLFLTTGFFARNLVGRKIIATGDQLVAKIPLISRIYIAVQQIRDVFVGRDGTIFHEVVLVEYPRKGVYVVGFVTSHEDGHIQQVAGEHLTAVFLPTTPNPTSGFLLYFSRQDLIPLDFTVEDAMKLIMSGGAYLPSKHGPPPLLDQAAEAEE